MTTPTWADTTIPNPTGGFDLRCRIASLISSDPTDPHATSIYPVDAEGRNLTRSPITVRTRVWLWYPLPTSLGRDGQIVTFPAPYWQPKEAA